MRHVFVWCAVLLALPVSAGMVSRPFPWDAGAFTVEGHGRSTPAVFHPPQMYQLSDLLQKVHIFSRDGKDPRVPLSREGVMAPIGILITFLTDDKGHEEPEPGWATSFLISPCHILGSDHMAHKRAWSRRALKIRHIFAYGRGYNDVAGAEAVEFGDYSGTRSTKHDWAVFRLTECVGVTKGLGWFDLTPNPPPHGAEVWIAGFYSDKDPRDLYGQPNFRLTFDAGKDTWYHFGAVRPGTSGSPLFYVDQRTGRPKVFATQSDQADRPDLDETVMTTHDLEFANFAVNLAPMLAKIRERLDKAIAAHGGPQANPLLNKAFTPVVAK